jgi:hypothetical protein
VSELSGVSPVVAGYEEGVLYTTAESKNQHGSSCQHLREWRNVDTHSQLPQDSLHGKALPSMEIDTLAAWNPECSMRA